jgi:hypothetical protein
MSTFLKIRNWNEDELEEGEFEEDEAYLEL